VGPFFMEGLLAKSNIAEVLHFCNTRKKNSVKAHARPWRKPNQLVKLMRALKKAWVYV